MPSAEVWHIGIYRDEETLKPVEYYNKLPVSPSVGVCLILDPMLATGGSASATIDVLKRWGVQRIKFVGIIAAPEGINHVHQNHPDIPLHLAAIDDHLNEVGYIVPGLGDAGDRPALIFFYLGRRFNNFYKLLRFKTRTSDKPTINIRLTKEVTRIVTLH